MNIRKHSPAILTAVGVAGFVATVVMAVKSTSKCEKLLDEAEARLKEATVSNNPDISDEELKGVKLSKKETINCFAKAYWTAAAMGVISTACFVAANYVHGKREAVLATAFGASELALKEFQKATFDVAGEKVVDEIRAKVADEKLKANPVTTKEVIVTNPAHETLCFDSYSGRYFKSDLETIRQKINDLNERLIQGDFVSLNDLYYELGLPEVKLGEDMGWHNYHGETIEVSYSARIAEDGTPCIVMSYNIEPAYWNPDFI